MSIVKRIVFLIIFLLLSGRVDGQMIITSYWKYNGVRSTGLLFSANRDTVAVAQSIQCAFDIGKKYSDSAIGILSETRRLSQELEWGYGISKSLYYLGMVYSFKGMEERAVQYYYKAIFLMEQSTDLSSSRELAEAYSLLVRSFNNLGTYSGVLPYLKKAEEIAVRINDPVSLSRILNNTGIIYSRMGKTENARKAFDRAMDLSKKNKLFKQQYLFLQNAAAFSLRENKPKQAKAYLKQSFAIKELEIAKDDKVAEGASYDHYLLGNIYLQLKDYSKAIEIGRAHV